MADDLAIETPSEEQYLEFLAALKSLVRSDHISPDDRLAALDRALELATAGNVADGADLVDEALLGAPGQSNGDA
ncbi:MAG: hypothetical protein ACYCSF_08750 [Acidimicrobiales bacterium]